jgi:hypothetical protein
MCDMPAHGDAFLLHQRQLNPLELHGKNKIKALLITTPLLKRRSRLPGLDWP